MATAWPASALLNGYEWVFIDTAPTTWLVSAGLLAKDGIDVAGRLPILVEYIIRPERDQFFCISDAVCVAQR